MTSVQIPDEIALQYRDRARAAGRDTDAFISEALLTMLEDMEDIEIAKERIANPGRRISLEEIERDLDLED